MVTAVTQIIKDEKCWHADDSFITGKVLIVDDEPQISSMLKKMLEGQGFEIMISSNGLEALEVLEKQSFDFLITDFKMPKMNGDVLVETAKQKGLLDNCAVILITGAAFTDNHDNQEILKNKFDGFIGKPFSKEVLISQMKQAKKTS